jgi:hypothetical protein
MIYQPTRTNFTSMHIDLDARLNIQKTLELHNQTVCYLANLSP